MLLKQLSGRCSCCKDMSSEATAGLLQASEQGRLDQAEGLCGLFCSFAEGHEELLRSQTEQVESALLQACLLRTRLLIWCAPAGEPFQTRSAGLCNHSSLS